MSPEAKTIFQHFTYGLMAMIFFHHAWVSFFLYRARNSNISNIFKIIFNLSGLGRALAIISTFLISPTLPLLNCQILNYTSNLLGVLFRTSLGGFLIYRVKQIENRKYDSYIGYTLLFCSGVLQVVHVFLRESRLVYQPTIKDYVCSAYQHPLTIKMHWTILALDLAIDLYVSGRLLEILTKANQNARHVTSNMRRPNKRTLFTSVMYWNFLRLTISVLYHVMTGVNALNIADPFAMSTLLVTIYILLSYIVTADAEIVRVIEGRKPVQPKASAGSEKTSIKNSIFRRGQTSTKDTDPAFSEISYEKPSLKKPEQNDEAVFVTSMRRLSFFEWARVVSGKKGKSSEEIGEDENDSIEEVQQDATENRDLELGCVNDPSMSEDRRGSSVSATTIAAELTVTSGGEHKPGEAL